MTSLQLGLRLRDEGIALVSSHNEVFLWDARYIAAEIAYQEGCVSIDQVKGLLSYDPAHPNAWAGVLRGPCWELVGYKASEHPDAHARRIGKYRLTERGREELLGGNANPRVL